MWAPLIKDCLYNSNLFTPSSSVLRNAMNTLALRCERTTLHMLVFFDNTCFFALCIFSERVHILLSKHFKMLKCHSHTNTLSNSAYIFSLFVLLFYLANHLFSL